MKDFVCAIILSAVFTFGKWLLSIMHVCENPTWRDFVFGAAGLFLLFIGYRIARAIRYTYLFKKYPAFKVAYESTGISWSDYKRLKKL